MTLDKLEKKSFPFRKRAKMLDIKKRKGGMEGGRKEEREEN